VLKHGDNTTSARDPVIGSDSGVPASQAAIDMSLGQWLYQRRLALGLTIPSLARRLKVQGRYIEALERDDIASLPGQPYISGYVRSLAIAMELDQQEAMARLQAIVCHPKTIRVSKSLNFPMPSVERRLPISAIISASLAISIAAYAYWYATKSADMGRPLLSPVADLEASSDAHPEQAHLTPAPGPLQPLGVPSLAESVDAANALGQGAVTRRSVLSARQPLPAGVVPRPRPGTPAAAVWAARIEWPFPDKDELSDRTTAVAAAQRSPVVETQGLPAAASLAAYLPAVRLRSDLGPLRGPVGLPSAVTVARHDLTDDGAAEPVPVTRTQAFAAVPSSNALLKQSGRTTGQAWKQTGKSYDPLATLPPVDTNAATPSETIVVIADEPCWIEIKTATGRVLAQKLLQVGERFTVPGGHSGLQLTAGNAGGIRVLVDGVTAASLGSSGQVVRGVSLNPYQLLTQR
jgi:cytoskeleton protein RodZ